MAALSPKGTVHKYTVRVQEKMRDDLMDWLYNLESNATWTRFRTQGDTHETFATNSPTLFGAINAYIYGWHDGLMSSINDEEQENAHNSLRRSGH